jgi:hypothetical protein
LWRSCGRRTSNWASASDAPGNSRQTPHPRAAHALPLGIKLHVINGDVIFLITDILKTVVADVTLDGQFDADDLSVLQNYERINRIPDQQQVLEFKLTDPPIHPSPLISRILIQPVRSGAL